MDNDTLITKMIISYIGIIGLYLNNPKFQKLKLDMKKYRNTVNNINPDSVDVFSLINEAHEKGLLSVKQAKLMYNSLMLFRDSKIDENELKSSLNDVLFDISNKTKRFLPASIIMIVNNIKEKPIDEILKILFSYTKRKKFDIDFVRYYKISRGK